MSSKTARPLHKRSSLDTLTASLVGRQSRTDDESESISDQVAAMRSDCKARGWHVGGVYEESDVSGQRPLDKRHGLKQAIEDVEAGRSQVVMVAYFDRLCRNLKTQLAVVDRVEAAGGIVQIAGGETLSHKTPTARLTGSLLGAVSEYVALTAGERTAVTKQRNIDAGIPPFPHITPAYERIETGKNAGRLRPHKTNAPLVREACQMRARGTSYVSIAKWLNEQGLTKTVKRGDKLVVQPLTITPTGVESMLGSKLLIGEIHFGGFTPNLNAIDDPLIGRALFARMHKAYVSRGRYGKSERLLARQEVLVCKTCNGRMSVQSTRNRKSGKTYAYYRCGDKLCARPALISAPYVENAVRDKAIELSKAYKGRASQRADLEAARLAVAEIDERLDATIETLNMTGVAARASSRRVLSELHAEHEAAVAYHERLKAHASPSKTISTARHWDALTLDEKRGVIRSTISRVVVAPHVGKNPGPRVAPGRLKIESRTLLS